MLTEDLSDFAPEEYQRRLAGLRELMAANEMDAVLLTTDSNHRYFTGHVTHRWMHKYTALFALLPLKGEPVLIVTPNEACMCEEDSWIEKIRTFSAEHTLQGVEAITDAVRELGLEEGRIGTELGGVMWMRMPLEDFDQLRQNLPRAEFIDASSLLWKLRARKSGAEVDLIRQAVAITDQAYQVLFQELKPGMTERDIYRLLAVEHLSRGADTPGSITLAPHIPGDTRPSNRTLRRHTDRVLTRGELIAQDAGGSYRGYWSDYTRMYALGQASSVHKEAYRVVYDCLQAAIAATRAGVPIADLVHASNAAMKAAGYAEHAEQVSGIGHAIGLDVIEPPFIAFENDVLLEEGMILTVEPALTIDDAFIMLEEDVLVTDQGHEILSAPAPVELPIL
jgi:Xaa-Pro dipeptidase